MQWVSSFERRPTDASNRMANHQLNKEDPPLTGLAGFYVYFIKALLPCVATFCSDSHAVKDRFFGVGGLGVQVRRDIFLVHLAPSYFFVILLSHVGKGNCCFAS